MDAPKHAPVVVESLGDLSGREYLSASCRRCFHSSMLDIQSLIQWFGPGYPIARIMKRLKCKKCGAFDGEIKQGHAGGWAGLHK